MFFPKPLWRSFADVGSTGSRFLLNSKRFFFYLTFTDFHMGRQKVAKFEFQVNNHLKSFRITGIPQLVRFFGPHQTILLEKVH